MPLYFAYGSNLDTAQMGLRCDDPQIVGIAFLNNHRFVFAGTSHLRENMGVGSIRKAPSQQCAGLLWSISEADLAQLDKREGHPVRYQRAAMHVTDLKGRTHAAWVYLKEKEVPLNAPSEAYLQQVLKAYDAHGFDTEIIHNAYAEAVQANRD